jgi:hypothetical protein
MSVRLYAVLRLRPRAGASLPVGMQGERLRIVKSAGCALAVADARAMLEPAVENLLEFDGVIRALAELSEAILPARFGAVSATVASLKAEMAERAGDLSAALDSVAGRVQMTVRIPAGPTAGPKGSGGTGRGANYLNTRAAAASPPAAKKMRTAVAGLVRDERIEAGSAATSVYHLIDRSDVAAYLARLKGLRVSGPFPPYAFVPGIDHALWLEHDDKTNKSADARPARPRANRRSPRNAH